jgi:hypothetical protein
MAFSDGTDRLSPLIASQHKIIVLSPQLTGPEELTIPATVPLDGAVSLAIGKAGTPFDGKYYVASANHALVHQLSRVAGAPQLAIDESFVPPGIATPAGLATTDIGTLVVSDGAALTELTRTSTGAWAPLTASEFTGQRGAAGFAMATSRTNFNPVLHGGWSSTVDPGHDAGVPDPLCSADFNNDGDVGTDGDIADFFACLAGNCCPECWSADFNNDGDLGTDADIESFFRVLAGGNC